METQINNKIINEKINLDFKDSKYATGRRKKSIAKVWLKRGSGNIHVNGKKMVDYFQKSNLVLKHCGERRATPDSAQEASFSGMSEPVQPTDSKSMPTGGTCTDPDLNPSSTNTSARVLNNCNRCSR